MTRHSWVHLLAILAIGGLLAGCATRDSGYRISDETIAFIQPGVTTRSEIVENLGTPLLELKEPRVVAYSWGKLRATGGKPAAQSGTMGTQSLGSPVPLTDPSEESGLIETRRWVCCIALDGNDRVTRLEKLKLEGAQSLENAVRRWGESGR